jgi:RimJ/RimL family protein N-acetyltransferase
VRDAVNALENELYQVGLNRIVILCEKENQRSRTIPKSLGYTYEGELRELKRANEKYVTVEVYSKLRREHQLRIVK